MDIPLLEVQFDKDGNVFSGDQEAAVIRFLTNPPGNQTTDVVVLSHGWNNDMNEARSLYRGILGNLASFLPADRAGKVAAIGILWPSKRFADEELIPSGAASVDESQRLTPTLIDKLEQLRHTLASPESDAKIDALVKLVPVLERSADNQRAFVKGLAEALRPHLDPQQSAPEEGTARLEDQDGAQLLQRMKAPLLRAQTAMHGSGGAAGGLGNPATATALAGGAVNFADSLNSVSAGAMRLLNLTTYYVMKDRAGVVGWNGANPMLSRVQAASPAGAKFHFVGHSMGARLLTAAVDGKNKLRAHSLLLLQAAFSHNGYASKYDGQNNGFFANVVQQHKVSGPIVITYTQADRAVGIAYPLASRLQGDAAAALGDANDRFGGMGRNGALHMGDVAVTGKLLPARTPYQFGAGKVFNLDSNGVITSHGDVVRPETAWALASAMMA